MESLLLLKDGRLQVAPGVHVLRADEYGEMLKAATVLEHARVMAEQKNREAEEAYERRKEEGYQEGLLAGKMEIANRMMNQMISSVNYLERMEATMVDVVIGGLRKILDDMGDRERIVSVVKKALSYVRNQKKVILRLNPAEAEMVNERLEEIMRGYPGIGLLDIAPDARLPKGGCSMECELGVIDGSVETQLEAIRRSFLRRLGGEASV
jgi:type III secretion protein L